MIHDARDVGEDVDAWPGRGDQAIHVALLRDIRNVELRTHAKLIQCAPRAVKPIRVDIATDHGCTLLHQPQHGGAADTTARAGDEGDAVGVADGIHCHPAYDATGVNRPRAPVRATRLCRNTDGL